MTPLHFPRKIRTSALLLGFALFVAFGCAARETLPTLDERPLSRSEAQAAEEAFERGIGLAQAGSHTGALEEFTRIVEQYPSSRVSATALYWQGRTFYQLGDDGAAARALERYIHLSPRIPNREQATFLLANSRYNLQRYDAALTAALEVEQASPDRLHDFLALAGDLLERLPRTTIENATRAEPARNWMAPFYLQAARWAYAAGDSTRGSNLVRQTAGFLELPQDLLAEARALTGPGALPALSRIGFLAPSEGRFAGVTEEIRRGIELALADINRGRGVPYELVARSTSNDPDSTLGAIRALARGERVRAILGPLTSELALSAGEAAREEGVTLVSPTATDARLLEAGPRVYTVNALDGAIGHTIGTYAVLNLDRRRFAILAVDNVYGRIQADAFAQAVGNAGASVVYRHVYAADAAQFTDRLGEIVRAQADAVFIATQSPAEALRILNQIAFFELGGLLPLGTDAWNDDDFYAQGRRFVRGYFADTFSRDSLVTRWPIFARDYAARYGEEPESLIPAWGYDATRLALEWLSDPPGEPARATTTRGPRGAGSPVYHGSSALFRITPEGVRRAVVVHRIEGGQPVAVDW
ncbi:MAG TPA: penicillin-binding protein activator [Gemmatimonadota bacterium]|nr:penicillin-binding protein activator [Gemmatimonadota bacterium]